MRVNGSQKCVSCKMPTYWDGVKGFLSVLSHYKVEMPRELRFYLMTFVIIPCECPNCITCFTCESCTVSGIEKECCNGEIHTCHHPDCMRKFEIDASSGLKRLPFYSPHRCWCVLCGTLTCLECIKEELYKDAPICKNCFEKK